MTTPDAPQVEPLALTLEESARASEGRAVSVYYGGLFAGITIGLGVSALIFHNNTLGAALAALTIWGGVTWARHVWLDARAALREAGRDE